MNNFIQRTLTAVVFAVVMVSLIWFHAFTFFVLLLGIATVGTFELSRLVNTDQVKVQRFSPYLLSVMVIVVGFGMTYYHLPVQLMLLLLPIVAGVFIYELYRDQERPFWNIAIAMFIPLYVAIPFFFLQLFSFCNGDYDPYLVLTFVGMVWASDTGAYLSGVTMGKHKLFPRISPKKSWEGFIGGVVLTLLLGWGISYFSSLTLFQLIGMALIVSILGTLGDLIESMLKRSVGVKDSGSLMPGHGGILDRFDAYVLAAPMVYFFLQMCDLIGVLL